MGATSATNELEEAQKKAEDSLRAEGEAGIRVIDKKIKSIQDEQKASEKAIDARIKKIQEERKAYEESINAELKLLEDRKKALEDALKNYDATAGVVDYIGKQIEALNKQKDETSKFYDDQLKALDDTNKALQDKIALEKSLEAIEKAKSQKVMIFRDGKFEYEENQTAVGDATEAHDKLKAEQELQAKKDQIEAERDAKLEALDAEIERQQKYQDLWKEATNAYQKHKDEMAALELLEVGWEKLIAEQRTDILEKFAEEHYNKTAELQENVLTQIETLQKQKKMKWLSLRSG